MKRFSLILLIGIVGMTSCNEEFLDRAPLTSMSDANFWKSENDLRLYVNNFYNDASLLPTYQAGWFTQGPYSQDAERGSDTYVSRDYIRRLNGEMTLPASGGGWAAGNWASLRKINYFLDNYKLVDAPLEVVNKYIGEALVFRSIFYFEKLRSFGALPWVSSVVALDADILYEPRLPRNQVVDSIMKDLDLAVEYLAEQGGNSSGRISKEVALALQARIALYEGTWERYHGRKNTPFKVESSDGSQYIQKAADAAGTLIALGDANGYPALDNVGDENGYWSLFNQKDYSNHKEVLLWRRYSSDIGLYHRWIYYTFNGGSNGITKSLVDSYLCSDGKPIAASPLYNGDKDLQTVVANRDPRLSQTVQVDDGEHFIWREPEQMFTTPAFEGLNEQRCVTGYQLYKGHTADYSENQNGVMSTSGLIYFRYAETLLIYAEAKAELGTITQEDIDKTINALRLRVGMTNGLLDLNDIISDPNWEFTGLTPVLQEIRRERKVELACEGFRTDDIFRWAAADELLVGKRPLGAYRAQWDNYPDATPSFLAEVEALPINESGYIDPYRPNFGTGGYQFRVDRDYLLPIPTNEIVLNPVIEQNPGW